MNKQLIISPPKSDEYPEEFDQYIQLVPSEDLLDYFHTQQLSVATLAAGLSEEQLLYRYDEGKWSVKDIFCHLIDCERIYDYRALCIARGDRTAFPGFEENDYVATANSDSRDINSIVTEYKAVRTATIELFKSFDEAMLHQVGIANGSKRSVRAIGYSLAGHELHHLNVIKERYINQ